MPTTQPVTVFIADDHRLVIEGIKTLLNVPEVQVVGEASDGRQLEQCLIVDQVPVDVLLLDLNMPDFKPVAFVQRLKAARPDVKILAVTGAPDARTIEAMVRHGLEGCMLKTASSDLLAPLLLVAQGHHYMSVEAHEMVVDFQRRESSDTRLSIQLAERDLQVLILLAQGRSNDDIARHLGVGRATANNYVSRLYSTIEVENRAQATTWALKHGLLSVEDTQG